MKLLAYPLLTAVCLLVGACKKTVEPTTSAIITGYDPRNCGCCGGLMVTFTADPRPFGSDFKLIDNTADLGLSSTEIFPLYVKINYESLPDKCGGNHLNVTKLVRQ